MYSFINIFGLAVGMACCILILLFVHDEFSYDHFHENLDDIYRVVLYTASDNGAIVASSIAPHGLGPTMVESFPEIVKTVRFRPPFGKRLVGIQAKGFYEDGFVFADPNVFDVFSFRMLQGNPETALERPFTVVLTQTMAEKYFGPANPLGRTIRVDNTYDYEVTGVLRDAPSASSIQFNFLVSFATLYQLPTRRMMEYNEGWNMSAFSTYVRLLPGASASTLKEKLPDLVKILSERRGMIRANTTIRVEPFKDVYLYAEAENQLGPNGEVRYIYIFVCVALLILLVAAINYMNLTVALSLRRAREVGVRKAAGATPGQLAIQFLAESICSTLGAVLLAVALVELALPEFNNLVQKSLSIRYFGDFTFLSIVFAVVFLASLVAGSYPAFVFSRFRATEALRGNLKSDPRGSGLQRGLVVFQFGVSVALLVCTMIIQNQMDYVRSKRLGLNPEQVVAVPVRGALSKQQASVFKHTVLQDPRFSRVTVSSGIPSQSSSRISIEVAGLEGQPMAHHYAVDTDFLDTFQMDLAMGRSFSEDLRTDVPNVVLINEALAALAGWDDPIGKGITYGGNQKGTVVGVVRDFHFESLHHEIAPLFITPIQQPWSSWAGYVSARIQVTDLSGTLAQLKATWRQFAPDHPLDYFFLDAAFDRFYRSEQRLAQIFGVFFALTIIIACLGLFGLAAYTAQQRTKELGIRKVLGASVSNLVVLLSKDFAKLVLIGIAVAFPVSYFSMHRWLQNFAYRTEIGVGTFLLAGVLALLIALLTVGYQAIKWALANPVDALRYE